MSKLTVFWLSLLLTACNVPVGQDTEVDKSVSVVERAKTSPSDVVKPIPAKSKYLLTAKPNLKDYNLKDSKVWRSATVKYMSFEGGFYGLITNNGTKLLPMNLDKEFKLDGNVVQVKGNVLADVMTIYQWGTPFKITEIKLLKKGKAKNSKF